MLDSVWAEAVDLWYEGDVDGAEQRLRQLVARSDPETAAAAAVVHAVLMREEHGDLTGAEGLLDRAAADGTPDVQALARLHLGVCYEAGGRTAAAGTAYTEAMRASDPACAAQAALQLGWLLMDADRDDRARRAFERGLAHDDETTTPWLHLALGQIEQRDDRSERVVARWEQAAQATDPLAVGYSLLLRRQAYLAEHETDEAEAMQAQLVETPGTEELWPLVLADTIRLIDDGDSFGEAMTGWLTWLSATGSTALAVFDRSRQASRLVAVLDGDETLLYTPVPRQQLNDMTMYAVLLNQRLRGAGFADTDDVPEDQPEDLDRWLVHRPEESDAKSLAGLCRSVFRKHFRLSSSSRMLVRWRSEVPLEPLPRPPLPTLLP